MTELESSFECAEPKHGTRKVADLPPQQTVERAAGLFRALGDESRLRLLVRLMDGECCVGDLAAAEGEGLSTISQRLRVLRAENIVTKTRQGKHVNYRLADTHVAALVRNALQHAVEPDESVTGEEL